MPVGCYGASSEIMLKIAPDGDVYQAGTLSGNPISMSAGKAALDVLVKDGFYEDQAKRTLDFVNDLRSHIKKKGYKISIFTVGSIFWLAFSDLEYIRTADAIDDESMKYFKAIFGKLLDRGVYLGPSGYEVGFISQAHTPEILSEAAQIIKDVMDEVNDEIGF